MSADPVERIAAALLYEGYLLYPYRPSSVKNRQRFNFGVVYPEAYGACRAGDELSEMRTECVIVGDADTVLDVRVRFLQLAVRVGESDPAPWQEAIEREVPLAADPIVDLAARSRRTRFTFPATETVDGAIRRRQCRVHGVADVAARAVGEGVFLASVTIGNASPWSGGDAPREDVLSHSLVSAHTILRARRGEFVSLLDPPDHLRAAASLCRNVGTWPVLVGEDGSHHTMLSSPIIVYDYPRIAPESAGDLFDATEIDEILSLRIMTLTDEEKAELRRSDDRARRLLDRTESLTPEAMMRLHGTMRPVEPVRGP
jgi:hydrogenase maturation protease